MLLRKLGKTAISAIGPQGLMRLYEALSLFERLQPATPKRGSTLDELSTSGRCHEGRPWRCQRRGLREVKSEGGSIVAGQARCLEDRGILRAWQWGGHKRPNSRQNEPPCAAERVGFCQKHLAEAVLTPKGYGSPWTHRGIGMRIRETEGDRGIPRDAVAHRCSPRKC